MKPAMNRDLILVGDVLEALVGKLPNLTMSEMVDLAARLKPIAKHCKTIDDAVKEEVKGDLNDKEGEVPGEMFKAVYKIIPTDRFQQKAFAAAQPALFKKYVKTEDQDRVTFEVR